MSSRSKQLAVIGGAPTGISNRRAASRASATIRVGDGDDPAAWIAAITGQVRRRAQVPAPSTPTRTGGETRLKRARSASLAARPALLLSPSTCRNYRLSIDVSTEPALRIRE